MAAPMQDDRSSIDLSMISAPPGVPNVVFVMLDETHQWEPTPRPEQMPASSAARTEAGIEAQLSLQRSRRKQTWRTA